MPRAEWRSQAAYEGLRSLDAPCFAWEFLNRNPDFEHDRARLDKASKQGPLSATELDRFARRWGVRFHDGGRQPHCSTPLDGSQLAERDRDSVAPARSGRVGPDT